MLEARLSSDGVFTRHVPTTHAFHSPLLDVIEEPLLARLRTLQLQEPSIPYLSNLTGTWIEPGQATDPHYWVRHARETVRFSEGMESLFEDPDPVLLEVGPGSSLCGFAAQHPRGMDTDPPVLVPSMRSRYERKDDEEVLLGAAARLWLADVTPHADALASESPRRVPLPTYPFERRRYWNSKLASAAIYGPCHG